MDAGQVVEAGDIIGLEGMTGFATGCHLHYGLIRMDGRGSMSCRAWRDFGYPAAFASESTRSRSCRGATNTRRSGCRIASTGRRRPGRSRAGQRRCPASLRRRTPSAAAERIRLTNREQLMQTGPVNVDQVVRNTSIAWPSQGQ